MQLLDHHKTSPLVAEILLDAVYGLSTVVGYLMTNPL